MASVEQNDALNAAGTDSKCSPGEATKAQRGHKTPISLARALDFGDEGLLSVEPAFDTNSLSPTSESGRVINRRTTFRVDRRSAGMSMSHRYFTIDSQVMTQRSRFIIFSHVF